MDYTPILLCLFIFANLFALSVYPTGVHYSSQSLYSVVKFHLQKMTYSQDFAVKAKLQLQLQQAPTPMQGNGSGSGPSTLVTTPTYTNHTGEGTK